MSITRKIKKKKTDVDVEQQESRKIKLFYDLVWSTLRQEDRKCQQCGRVLGRHWKSWMFDHLLEKSTYPDIMYERWNIFICCFQCHGNKSNGFPGDKHKEAIERAKEIYKHLKEGNSDTEQQ